MSDLDRLRTAADRLRDARAALDGADDVDAVAGAHEDATSLLRRYEDDAVGTGDFGAYLEFQEAIAELVEDLPEDLPRRGAFEAALDAVDKRRLSERDFERAREALAPAADYAGRKDDLAAAKRAYEEARRGVRRRLEEVEDRIEETERLVELGAADLDAPVADLRDPIESYDEGVRAAFREYRSTESAREVLSLAETAATYPLVPVEEPPADLHEYVETNEAGELPIPKLLEYAEYSSSKLDHYVDDPQELKRRVATRQTYLERLDGTAFSLTWPPAPAAETRYRVDELLSVVSRFAPEDVVASLRAVQTLAYDEDAFDRLRTAAVAREELSDEERRRVASGSVEEELADLRAEANRLRSALEEYPAP